MPRDVQVASFDVVSLQCGKREANDDSAARRSEPYTKCEQESSSPQSFPQKVPAGRERWLILPEGQFGYA